MGHRQKQWWVLDKKCDGSDNGTADMTICSLHYRKKTKVDHSFKAKPNDQVILSNYCSSITECDNKNATLSSQLKKMIFSTEAWHGPSTVYLLKRLNQEQGNPINTESLLYVAWQQ